MLRYTYLMNNSLFRILINFNWMVSVFGSYSFLFTRYIYSELYEICLRINLYSTCKLHFIFQFRLSLIVIISLRRQRLFDCYSNQTLLSTFDSYDWGWRTRQMKIRRKMDERIKNNSKVKPKFFVDKCNGFRSIWIQIETRKRFGELLGK